MARRMTDLNRALWKGDINFGLINIPVRMVPAFARKGVSFHLLHNKDKSRLQEKLVCSVEQKEVPWEETVRGYEIHPGEHVVIEKEELNALASKSLRNIDVLYFTEASDIDPLFYDQAFYLLPEKGAERLYTVFRDALDHAGKVAVARFVMRNKEHASVLRSIKGVLGIHTLYFADEIIPPQQIKMELPKIRSHERELRAAMELMNSLSARFAPQELKDEYRQAVLELVEKKAEGKAISLEPVEEEEREVPKDLLAALHASLAHARRTRHGGLSDAHRYH